MLAICDVLERLIALQDAAGDYEAAIQSGRRLVTLEPLSESGQRALMRAYARGGRRGEALRQYKSCANTLQRELGVTPDEETQALARSDSPFGRGGSYGKRHTEQPGSPFVERDVPIAWWKATALGRKSGRSLGQKNRNGHACCRALPWQ